MDSGLQNRQNIVAKFDVKNKPLYVNVLWEKDDEVLLSLQLFYEGESWSGKYLNAEAAKRRERLDETVEEYNRNIKNSLSGNCKNYIYDFTTSPHELTSASFTWKKQYEGALLTHGVVSLQKDETPMSKDKLLDLLLKKNKNLISEVELANKTNEDLKQELEQYVQKLEELTASKIMLESTLYGRFIQVLNEKKKRICLLEEQLTN